MEDLIRILVAGDDCIDRYIIGESTRMSPEDPSVPVVKVLREYDKEGMTSNVYHNLKSIGAVPLMVTAKPSIKTRVFSNGKQIARLDEDNINSNPDALKRMRDMLPEVHGLIVQDYGKGFWTEANLAIIGEAKLAGVPVFVDPYPTTPLHWYKGCTIITPNESEAETLTGEDDTQFCLDKLLTIVECEHAIITLGEQGFVSRSKDEWVDEVFHSVKPVTVVDPTGAGDTVIALLSYSHLKGYAINQCIEIAGKAAGLVIQQPGVASITREQFESICTS